MARLTRKNQKIFAENATNNGVFGSLQAGNPITTNDVEQIQSLPAYSQGWNAATMTSETLPSLEESQALNYINTYQLGYILQEGIPEYSASTTYYKGCLVKYVNGDNFQILSSKTDDNQGNGVTNQDYWTVQFDSANPPQLVSNMVDNLDSPTDDTHPNSQAVKTYVDTALENFEGDFVTPAQLQNVDNSALHKTGDETKKNRLTLEDTGLNLKHTSNVNGQTEGNFVVNFLDKNGLRNALLQAGIKGGENLSFLNFAVTTPDGSLNENSWVTLVGYPDGSVNFQIPTPSSANANTAEAATCNWVNSRITAVMDSAGFVKKPNYSNYINIPMTNGSIFNTPADGWLALSITAHAESKGGSHLEFQTSGATVHASGFYNTGGGGLMFVPKNESVKLIVESSTTKRLYRFYYTV